MRRGAACEPDHLPLTPSQARLSRNEVVGRFGSRLKPGSGAVVCVAAAAGVRPGSGPSGVARPGPASPRDQPGTSGSPSSRTYEGAVVLGTTAPSAVSG